MSGFINEQPTRSHAELVLSAIAKFLVHLFGEEGRGEVGEGEGRKREWRETGRIFEVREMGMQEK